MPGCPGGGYWPGFICTGNPCAYGAFGEFTDAFGLDRTNARMNAVRIGPHVVRIAMVLRLSSSIGVPLDAWLAPMIKPARNDRGSGRQNSVATAYSPPPRSSF